MWGIREGIFLEKINTGIPLGGGGRVQPLEIAAGPLVFPSYYQ